MVDVAQFKMDKKELDRIEQYQYDDEVRHITSHHVT